VPRQHCQCPASLGHWRALPCITGYLGPSYGGREELCSYQIGAISKQLYRHLRKHYRLQNKRAKSSLPSSHRQFIEQTVNLNLPNQFRDQYLKVLLKNHEAVSQNKFDLGQTDTLMHEIALKTSEPIYVKQFKIPDAHRQEVERHMLEWLKLGVIQPARSRYNSPIFAVMKKMEG
jgi:hypothetical protein